MPENNFPPENFIPPGNFGARFFLKALLFLMLTVSASFIFPASLSAQFCPVFGQPCGCVSCGCGTYDLSCACIGMPTITSCNTDTNCGGYSCDGGPCQSSTNCTLTGMICSGGVCVPPPVCGDGTCNGSETCSNCVDCYSPLNGNFCNCNACTDSASTCSGTRNSCGVCSGPLLPLFPNPACYGTACYKYSSCESTCAYGTAGCLTARTSGTSGCDSSNSCTSATCSATPPSNLSPYNTNCNADGQACTYGLYNCLSACVETQETADISVAFDGFAGSATFPWTARNLRGSCSGTGATTCGPVPVSAGGSTPDASSTYSLDSYFGITPTYSVTHSLTCNSAGPISRGTASFSTVHYHVGTVSVQVQLGSVVSWSLTGPGGYVYAGAGTLTLDNVPYTGAAGEITVVGNPGTFICVSLSSISPGNCTAFSGGAGENFGVGGSYGLPVRLSVPILHHVTQPVYIYSQTAPTPAISLTVPSPSKLYQSSPSVTLTGGTPRAYVLTTIQKSGPGGTAEGNVDDCAGLTTLAPYNTTILTNSSGNYSGSLFVFGDAGPVLNQNAIGCWKLGIAVNNVPSSPSFLPAGGIKVYAGILAIKPVVNNGAKSGGVAVIEPMATRPTATWTYPTGLATENCGASPCTGFSIPAGSAGYVADPLKQSGSSAPNHDIVFPAVNLTPPYFPPYNNAAMLNWVNKCNDTSLTVSKKEAKQGMPATGCAAPDRGNLQYNWQLINTRIRVRATVNGGPFIGTPPGTTGGTSSGNGNGSVAFPTTPIPGRYTITGPDTRTGTTAEGLHWGVRY